MRKEIRQDHPLLYITPTVSSIKYLKLLAGLYRQLWIIAFLKMTLSHYTVAESVMMTEDTLEVPMQEVRTSRLPSYHMRELSRGKFLFNSKNIALMDIIGGGVYVSHLRSASYFCLFPGEFGIVYKARINSSDRLVAVKTLKGNQHHAIQ